MSKLRGPGHAEVFASYQDRLEDVIVISEAEFQSYRDVQGIMLRGGDGKVWLLENGKKRWVMTPEAFKRFALDWNRIVAVNQSDFNAYPEGMPVE